MLLRAAPLALALVLLACDGPAARPTPTPSTAQPPAESAPEIWTAGPLRLSTRYVAYPTMEAAMAAQQPRSIDAISMDMTGTMHPYLVEVTVAGPRPAKLTTVFRAPGGSPEKTFTWEPPPANAAGPFRALVMAPAGATPISTRPAE